MDRRTFKKDDLLGREQFSQKLEKFVLVEKDYVEGSLVIALNGGFGSGKSAFIEMWASSLTERRGKGEFAPMPVILNAWESDHCGDPLISILSGLLKAVKSWKGDDKPNESKLREAAKDVGWFAAGLVNEFSAKALGINPVKAGELAEKKGQERTKKPDFIALYDKRVEALSNLKSELRGAFGGSETKVIVFVDELDRCRPDYAVSYLETIKHVFDVVGMIFVLAVDCGQLRSSAQALFGSDLNFPDYFRKFCHRTFSFPESKGGMDVLAEAYSRKYIEIEGKRASSLALKGNTQENLAHLVSGLEMRPRQIQEAFRLIGHATSTLKEENRQNLLWGISAGVCLLCCIKVTHPELFDQIRRGNPMLQQIGEILSIGLGKEEAIWWIDLYVSGASTRDGSSLYDELYGLGELYGGIVDVDVINAQFQEGWGYARRDESRIKWLAAVIEGADTID